MPGQDETGPMGYGPLTGRGLGPCGCGMRRIFGRGFGRGFGWIYAEPADLSKDGQKKILEAELKEIEAEKRGIEKRLEEMK
ncbi:MAG: DUF5320 domain-containing protein [Nanoarchaeota archaeon]|nr:DUF5320 domain-containing protein [Nanoarchaeota archaeon]